MIEFFSQIKADELKCCTHI